MISLLDTNNKLNEHREEKNRYSLIFNINEIDNKFNYINKLNQIVVK